MYLCLNVVLCTALLHGVGPRTSTNDSLFHSIQVILRNGIKNYYTSTNSYVLMGFKVDGIHDLLLYWHDDVFEADCCRQLGIRPRTNCCKCKPYCSPLGRDMAFHLQFQVMRREDCHRRSAEACLCGKCWTTQNLQSEKYRMIKKNKRCRYFRCLSHTLIRRTMYLHRRTC